MKLYRFSSLILSLCILICMYLCVRSHWLHPGENTNSVMLFEMVFVLLISTIWMQYIIRRHKEDKMGIAMESATEQFMVQICRLDHTEDVIHIMMNDILIIGRDISITHVAFPKELTISSQHCRLIYKNDAMYLEDLASTNGTFYRGKRILHQTQIESGSEIRIANIPFRLSWKLVER